MLLIRGVMTGDVCHYQELPAIRRPPCDRVGAPPRDVREDALLGAVTARHDDAAVGQMCEEFAESGKGRRRGDD